MLCVWANPPTSLHPSMVSDLALNRSDWTSSEFLLERRFLHRAVARTVVKYQAVTGLLGHGRRKSSGQTHAQGSLSDV